MRKGDRAWRPDLPTDPAPPRVWALTLLILLAMGVAYVAYRVLT